MACYNMSSSSYSEEDIRRAAELREWLIKQISDRQEEVERLRTTLSIIDNMLKQGSFKAAANLGFSTAAAPPAAAGATTAATTATAQVQQQPSSQAASQQQHAGASTLKATADGDDNSRRDNIRPLKRARDDFLLANAEVSPDAVVIVPAPGVNVNANTPPFRSFFLNRILEGMKGKDAEKVNQGALRESDALNYKVEEEGNGIIKRIVINNYRDKDRLQEIFNTSAWVFTRMLEKSGSGGG
jgi:light-regulated signal transduction histidine kinase (bacteriophytochrome)